MVWWPSIQTMFQTGHSICWLAVLPWSAPSWGWYWAIHRGQGCSHMSSWRWHGTDQGWRSRLWGWAFGEVRGQWWWRKGEVEEMKQQRWLQCKRAQMSSACYFSSLSLASLHPSLGQSFQRESWESSIYLLFIEMWLTDNFSLEIIRCPWEMISSVKRRRTLLIRNLFRFNNIFK